MASPSPSRGPRPGPTQLDSDFTTPGVTFLAASGDTGIYGSGGNQFAANYPAASPNVVSVGGTSIVIDSAGDYPGTGPSGEVAWGDGTKSGSVGGGGSGGGLSTVEPEPAWQSSGVVPPASTPPTPARFPTSPWTPARLRNTTSSRAR